jgi:hypothetical protein
MKKITTLILIISTMFGLAQNGGSTCGTAVAITPGSFTDTTINIGVAGSEMSGFTFRSSAWFSFTPAEDGTIDVSSCLGGADTNLYVGSGTCGSLTVIADNDDFCQFEVGNEDDFFASQVTDIPVLAGMTYYIEWDDLWDSTPFDWSLTFTPAPPCSQVTPDSVEIDFLLGDQVIFSWDPAPFGSPIGYNWEIVPEGAGQGNSVVVSGSGPETSASSGAVLTTGTNYDVYIQTNCGINGTSDYLGPLGFTTLNFIPPVNDLCAGAEAISVQGEIAIAQDAVFQSGSVANAVNSEVTNLICDGFPGSDSLDDMWYSFVAGSSEVNITANVQFDAVLTLFSGDCDNLVEIDCADDTISGPTIEQINATGLTVGDTYIFRVYSFGSSIPSNPNFEVAVWTPQTLSNSEVLANTEFTYFPNPVKNSLTLRAQNNIESVNVVNMVGQTVLKVTPNTIESEINMQTLGSGTYFAQVTIAGVTKTIKVLKQ